MIGGAGGVADDRNTDLDGARVGPPPDLPSLLLHNRIVYLGMPLVPAVTELIIAEVSERLSLIAMYLLFFEFRLKPSVPVVIAIPWREVKS